ncbi:DUF6401 family natural product biosynthesis protein [Micromonospora sp. NPDC049679]|uniref:DUF6401 family natural product biosynthesis protein n=1 Tax=Micromonospora sp. NPDC049679 TaxID=3155920 RepID=UPI0033ED16A2
MTNHFPSAAPTRTTTDAARVLDDVMARVGVDGLTTALIHPVLMALVDQHAAEVRESLRCADRPVDHVGLAAYARSIMAAAERMGRHLPEPGEADLSCLDWLRAPWPLLRLVGICALVDDTTLGAAPTGLGATA